MRILTLPAYLLQVPVMYVMGDAPSWWLWDSHVASPAERKSSSWQLVGELLDVVGDGVHVGTLIP
jgi:hypothetical protein